VVVRQSNFHLGVDLANFVTKLVLALDTSLQLLPKDIDQVLGVDLVLRDAGVSRQCDLLGLVFAEDWIDVDDDVVVGVVDGEGGVDLAGAFRCRPLYDDFALAVTSVIRDLSVDYQAVLAVDLDAPVGISSFVHFKEDVDIDGTT
jgi:hypothetical protein